VRHSISPLNDIVCSERETREERNEANRRVRHAIRPVREANATVIEAIGAASEAIAECFYPAAEFLGDCEELFDAWNAFTYQRKEFIDCKQGIVYSFNAFISSTHAFSYF
jgi:hypothetical protein